LVSKVHTKKELKLIFKSIETFISKKWDKHIMVRETAGKYVKSIVYGGLDGIITTFAIVAAVAGANLSATIVLILGFANMFADGVSMASGDYLSTHAQEDYDKANNKKVKKGESPLKNAVATFFSFIGFGFIPLIAYLIAPTNEFLTKYVFTVASILTLITFGILGWLKATVTNKHYAKGISQTIIVGGTAALIAYGIGWFISTIVGVSV
jgi:VIT1/CCC1 family predicted Fe2+/Mn2+ transporter